MRVCACSSIVTTDVLWKVLKLRQFLVKYFTSMLSLPSINSRIPFVKKKRRKRSHISVYTVLLFILFSHKLMITMFCLEQQHCLLSSAFSPFLLNVNLKPVCFPRLFQRDACSGPKQLECYESHIIKFPAKSKPIFYLLWLQIIFWKGWKPKPLIDGPAIWSHFTKDKNTAHCHHVEQKAQNNICCRRLDFTKYIIAVKLLKKEAGLLDFNFDPHKCTIMTRTGLAGINGLSPSSISRKTL